MQTNIIDFLLMPQNKRQLENLQTHFQEAKGVPGWRIAICPLLISCIGFLIQESLSVIRLLIITIIASGFFFLLSCRKKNNNCSSAFTEKKSDNKIQTY